LPAITRTAQSEEQCAAATRQDFVFSIGDKSLVQIAESLTEPDQSS
jgi:hypothetical protein